MNSSGDERNPPSPPAISIFEVYKREMKVRNYSPRTIKTYSSLLRRFVKYFHPKHPRKVNSSQIKDYLHSIIEAGLGATTIDQTINALRFLYVEVYHMDFILGEIVRPRSEKRLPSVMSKDEILRICTTVKNPVLRLILQLMYSSGLRVSEVVSLRVRDLHLDNLTLFVRGGKGHKDRITVFSDKLRPCLLRQTDGREAGEPLFITQRGGKYTTRSVQKVFEKAVKDAVCKRPCHAIPSAIVSLLTCWKPGQISATSRTCLVMPVY